MVKHTGQSYDSIEKDTDRDNFMDTAQAKKYGLIDSIITQKDTKKLVATGSHSDEPKMLHAVSYNMKLLV